MAIKILTFGKMSTAFYRQASLSYLTRISHYEPIDVLELKEAVSSEITTNIKRNTDLLLTKLSQIKDAEVVILTIEGSLVTSLGFSDLLNSDCRNGHRNLLFVIGPSDGLEMNKLSQFRQISLGRITLPYQLCRVVLLEQIYRGFKILNHETYHK